MRVGGWENVKVDYFDAVNENLTTAENTSDCGHPPSNALHLLREASDPFLPWTGVVFGLTISGTWYWCSDQVTHFITFGVRSIVGREYRYITCMNQITGDVFNFTF